VIKLSFIEHHESKQEKGQTLSDIVCSTGFCFAASVAIFRKRYNSSTSIKIFEGVLSFFLAAESFPKKGF